MQHKNLNAIVKEACRGTITGRSVCRENGWRVEVLRNPAPAKNTTFIIHTPQPIVPIPPVPSAAGTMEHESVAPRKRGRPAWKHPEALILEAVPWIRAKIEREREGGNIPGQVSYKMIAQWIGEDRISWHSVRKLHKEGSREVRKAITSIYRNAPVLIREAARLIGKEIKQAQKQKRRRVYRAVDIPEIARRIGEGNISMGAVYWSYNYGPEDVRSKIDSICRDNQVLIHEAIEFLVQERLRITDTSIAREAGLRLSCINREKKLRPGLREVINAAEEASRTWPKSSRAGVEDLSTDPAPLDDLQEMRNIFVQIDDRLAAVNCHRSYAISMPSTSRVDTPPLRPGHSLQWESSGAKGL